MMCPACQSKQSKIRYNNLRTGGQLQRMRVCQDCGLFYRTYEISAEVFAKLIELLDARRDLDAQLYNSLRWQGQVYEQTRTATTKSTQNKNRRTAKLDTATSPAC